MVIVLEHFPAFDPRDHVVRFVKHILMDEACFPERGGRL
jgi:hypothetical protein